MPRSLVMTSSVHTLIGTRGGVVFSGMGDGVAASFERATDAARAAMEIQAAIDDEAVAGCAGIRSGFAWGCTPVKPRSGTRVTTGLR